MSKPYQEPWIDDALADHSQASLPLELASDEKIVWVGKPHSRLSFAIKELKVGIFGLGFVTFLLLWITMVLGGGNNKWDRGRVVPAFATHNLVIAIFAGLFMLPPGLTMLTAPLRAAMRAPHTIYALTSRRAIICEPTIFGGVATREFPLRTLDNIRCLIQNDGTGDLILGTRRTAFKEILTLPDGFLAVGDVRAIESLVQKTLKSEGLGTAKK